MKLQIVAISKSKIKTFKWAVLVALGTCCLVFIIASRQWDLVGDSALIRYITFLLDKDFAPYRQIYDLNFPGSYFLDWTVKRLLGESAAAWRTFDLVILVTICWATYSLSRVQSRFAGLFAGLCFSLFHARDGAPQLGQRDLSMTALLIVGCTLLMNSTSPVAWLRIMGFGLFVGLSATIKPQAILFLLVAPALYLISSESRTTTFQKLYGSVRRILFALLGASIPVLGMIVWLISKGSLPAFWRTITCIIPLHARLGKHSFLYLLSRCLTASHATIFVLAVSLAIIASRDSFTSFERIRLRFLLVCGMAYGFISYMGQVKAYPYHRYPFVAFLFLFAALEFTYALNRTGIRQIVGVGGISFGLTLSILYTLHSARHRGQNVQVDSLTDDLSALGGGTLSGNIQCLDTIDGCLATLYRLHLTQTTGMLYDEFLFLPPNIATEREANTIADLQRDFLHKLINTPPYVIVMTPWLFSNGPVDYEKLQFWPALSTFLSYCYGMRIERHISGQLPDHPGYRLYVRLPSCVR